MGREARVQRESEVDLDGAPEAVYHRLVKRYVCEGNQEWTDYVLNTMALAVQRPRDLPDSLQIEILHRVKERTTVYEFLADFFSNFSNLPMYPTPSPAETVGAAMAALQRAYQRGVSTSGGR
jgi:hypothetical protein